MEEIQASGGSPEKKSAKKNSVTVPANKKGRHVMGMAQFPADYRHSRLLAVFAVPLLRQAQGQGRTVYLCLQSLSDMGRYLSRVHNLGGNPLPL